MNTCPTCKTQTDKLHLIHSAWGPASGGVCGDCFTAKAEPYHVIVIGTAEYGGIDMLPESKVACVQATLDRLKTSWITFELDVKRTIPRLADIWKAIDSAVSVALRMCKVAGCKSDRSTPEGLCGFHHAYFLGKSQTQ